MLKRSRIRSISSSCSDPTSLGCRGRTDADALGAWACPAVTALAASARPAMSDGAAAATSVLPPSRSASLYLSPPSCPIHPALGPFSRPFVHTVRAGLVAEMPNREMPSRTRGAAGAARLIVLVACASQLHTTCTVHTGTDVSPSPRVGEECRV